MPFVNKVYQERRVHIDVRKVPASSVPYGDTISRNGRTVWAAYDGTGTLVAVGATAGEARRKYLEARKREALLSPYYSRR